MQKILYIAAFSSLLAFGCKEAAPEVEAPSVEKTVETGEFDYTAERFSDIRILKYQIPGFDQLTAKQKAFVYHLSEAGYNGRDIMYDMNYRHNLSIRRALESVYTAYKGDKSADDWKHFETYLKQIWFANGLHHHYSMDKFAPQFSKSYFNQLLGETGTKLDGAIITAMFDPSVDAKKVSLDSNKDLLLASAVNFYDPDITEKEANAFYKEMMKDKSEEPISYGLNSKLVKGPNNTLVEKTWKEGGMYSASIKKIINSFDILLTLFFAKIILDKMYT